MVVWRALTTADCGHKTSVASFHPDTVCSYFDCKVQMIKKLTQRARKSLRMQPSFPFGLRLIWRLFWSQGTVAFPWCIGLRNGLVPRHGMRKYKLLKIRRYYPIFPQFFSSQPNSTIKRRGNKRWLMEKTDMLRLCIVWSEGVNFTLENVLPAIFGDDWPPKTAAILKNKA